MHTLDPLHFPLDLVRTDTSLSSSYLCPLQLPPTFPTPVCCRACTGGRGGDRAQCVHCWNRCSTEHGPRGLLSYSCVPGPVPACHEQVLKKSDELGCFKILDSPLLTTDSSSTHWPYDIQDSPECDSHPPTHPQASFPTLAKLGPLPKTILPAPGRPGAKATISQGPGPAP